MSGTALSYIADAYYLLNVFQQGATIPAPQAQLAFRLLNNMMGTLAQMTSPVVAREEWPIVADQESYSWGTGGDITSSRPPRQDSVTGADLILNATQPRAQWVEVPLAVYTDDSFRNTRIKYLPNSQPTGIYYQATSPLGTLKLWPVPNTSINKLALYRQLQFGSFADLQLTTYYFPDGYDEMILYNLAKRLAGPNGRTMTDSDQMIAMDSWAAVQRSNTKITDVANDLVPTGGAGWYNINTGQ